MVQLEQIVSLHFLNKFDQTIGFQSIEDDDDLFILSLNLVFAFSAVLTKFTE